MRKQNIIVVGAGLFGSIAATLCRAEGHEVTVIDAGLPWAASKASGCVLAPSWLSSLSSAQIDTAMGVLRSLYTVHDLEFQTNLLKKFKAQRVHTPDVLVKPDVEGRVTGVGNGAVAVSIDGRPSGQLFGKVLVAAGIGSRALLPRMPPIRALWGASMLIPSKMKEPRLHVYAPYRQAVAFEMAEGWTWFGDGTALIEKTWMHERQARIQATVHRAGQLFKLRGLSTSQVRDGARPYVEGYKAGYFGKVDKNTWVSTGGAKLGTVLAALQAHQFLKELW